MKYFVNKMSNQVRVLMQGKPIKKHVEVSVKKFHDFSLILYMGKYLGFFPINLNPVTDQSGKQKVQLTCNRKTFQSFYRLKKLYFLLFFKF
jgi:hypothetical protein